MSSAHYTLFSWKFLSLWLILYNHSQPCFVFGYILKRPVSLFCLCQLARLNHCNIIKISDRQTDYFRRFHQENRHLLHKQHCLHTKGVPDTITKGDTPSRSKKWRTYRTKIRKISRITQSAWQDWSPLLIVHNIYSGIFGCNTGIFFLRLIKECTVHTVCCWGFFFNHCYFPIEWSGLPHILTSCRTAS